MAIKRADFPLPDVTDPAYPLNTAPIEYVVRSC